MKYILVTDRFRRQLKKIRRYVTERNVVSDVKRFVQRGLAKGETYLETYEVSDLQLEVVKLRIRVHQVSFRYLIGVINDQEYLPIIIDLKKGRYGKNLSFTVEKKITKAIESAVVGVIQDYLNHTEEHPTLTAYYIE